VFLAFLPNVVPGLILGAIVSVVGWKLPKPFVDMLYKRRVKSSLFR